MSLITSVLKLGSANIALLGAQAITILLVGTLVPDEEFALFLIGLTVAQTFAAFSALRFDSAIPSATTQRELLTLLCLAYMAIGLFALIVSIGISLFSAIGLFELDKLPLIAAVVVGLITGCLASIQLGRLWAIRHGDLVRIQYGTLTRAVLTLTLRVAALLGYFWLPEQFSFIDMGFLLLVLELIIASTTAFILRPRAKISNWYNKSNKVTLRAVARKFWKFPLIETPSTVLNSFAVNAPIFLVTHFFGLTATAAFGLAYRVVAVPIGQLVLALTEVMQSRYSHFLRHKQMDFFRSLFLRSTAILAFGGIVTVGLMIVILEPAIVAIMGEDMRQFAQICIVIAPWIAANIVVNTNSRLLPLLRRQELKLYYDGYTFSIIPIIFTFQTIFGFTLLDFLEIYTFAVVSSYTVYWLLIRSAVMKEHRKVILLQA